jgi:hypothetical protein
VKQDLCELLDGKEGVWLGLRLWEAFKVSTVNEEDNAINFGEIVMPETVCCEKCD